MNRAGLAPIELSAVDRDRLLASMEAIENRAKMLQTPGDDDELSAITSFVKEFAELVQSAHRACRAEKEPHQKICADIDAFFKTVMDRAMKIDEQIDKIVAPYLQRQANEIRASQPQSE
jgi:hypothetical protein